MGPVPLPGTPRNAFRKINRDADNDRSVISDAKELYELMLQRDLIDSMGNSLIDPNQHRMVRKNQRSPSLRLRFGRRSDPALYQVDRARINNPSPFAPPKTRNRVFTFVGRTGNGSLLITTDRRTNVRFPEQCETVERRGSVINIIDSPVRSLLADTDRYPYLLYTCFSIRYISTAYVTDGRL